MNQENESQLIEGFREVARHVDSVEHGGGDLEQMAAMSAAAVGLCLGRTVTSPQGLETVLAHFFETVTAISMAEMDIRAERRSGQH